MIRKSFWGLILAGIDILILGVVLALRGRIDLLFFLVLAGLILTDIILLALLGDKKNE